MSTSCKRGPRRGSQTLLIAFALLGSCAYNIDDAARKSDRDRLNTLTVACAHEHTHACTDLGDDLTHTSDESRLSTWKEPVDLPLAKKVYQLGCESGEGQCCRALVEQNLATSPEQTARYRSLATAYGSPVRSAQEIASAEAQAQARVDAREASISTERTQEQLKAARDLQAAGALIQQTGDQIQQTLATGATTTPTPSSPTPVVTPTPASSAAVHPVVQHCRNRSKESRAGNGDLICITTGVGHPCIQDSECGTARCTVPGVATLRDQGESGNGVCCALAGRTCDKHQPCCPEAHCVPQYNIGAPDETGSCDAN